MHGTKHALWNTRRADMCAPTTVDRDIATRSFLPVRDAINQLRLTLQTLTPQVAIRPIGQEMISQLRQVAFCSASRAEPSREEPHCRGFGLVKS